MLQSTAPPSSPLIKLVGIARMAAEGNLVSDKARVEYRSLPTRKWLNRCHSQRVPFHWTINPYRGCEYGCKYCYARFTHEFLERRELDSFETEIYAKDWDAAAFREELRTLKRGQIIGLGTATDPYQPAERKFNLTRQALEVMAERLSGMSLFVTTKSDLVSRDADVYRRIAERNRVRVSVTVTTMRRELARLTEPFAPRPDLRMRAVSELAQASVPVGVIASPILPMITDSEENLLEVAKAAKRAGASQFGAGVLFLQPAAHNVFMPFIARRFPQYLKKYQASYRAGAYLRGAYPDRMAKLVESIRQQVGIPARDLEMAPLPLLGQEVAPEAEQDQLRLF
jgi:DNA repair photolyase